MTVHQEVFEVRTHGKGLVDVTGQVADIARHSGIRTGLCVAFVQHTSASLVIQENADPAVLHDLEAFFSELAPESRRWQHADEGPDDMPAHVRAALTKTSETIPLIDGRLGTGTWQGLYLWEHRRRPHTRRVVVTVYGE